MKQGWITAFCFWREDGKCFYNPKHNPGPQNEMSSMGQPTPVLQLDEARYHRIETSDVPPGWASVPVELNDNGYKIPCTMVAGLVGTRASSSGKDLHERPGETGLDTLSAVSGWGMYERKTDEEIKADKEAWEKEEAERLADWEKKFAERVSAFDGNS